MAAAEPYRIYLLGSFDLDPDAPETWQRLINAVVDDVALGVEFPAAIVYLGSSAHPELPDVFIHEWATDVVLPTVAGDSDAAA